ncbi:MAG: DNA-processing protein DprA [Bacteroidales bacterium]|jgi:DNA processing protein|nr:DNA-processing protein DprA [Bacteroidales bacterium]
MINIYELALAKTYGIGYKTAKQALTTFHSAEAIFNENKKGLETVFGSKNRTINEILNKKMFPQCESELEFMKKYEINGYFFLNDDYPQRLKHIDDPPICLFYQGNADINSKKSVAIVGSRKVTEYGKNVTNALVEYLSKYEVSINSGLAYGIDAYAHKAALFKNLPTFGVLAHGLDMIYPRDNFDLAQKMKTNGGLITEHFSKTKINPNFFPSRNRIIAGLSDLVIVVEAAYKSGALITARLAREYNREVIAISGKLNDEYSKGCNLLIRNNIAQIMTDFSDIDLVMNWDTDSQNQQSIKFIPPTLQNTETPEYKIYKTIIDNAGINIDDLAIKTNFTSTQLSFALLDLEMNNLITTLPGKRFKAI